MKKKLEEYREKHNHSYQEMANKLNVKESEYRDLERNYELIKDKGLKKKVLILLNSSSRSNISLNNPMLDAMIKMDSRMDAMIPNYIKSLNKITSTTNPNPFGSLSGIIRKNQEQYNPFSNSLAFLSGAITPSYMSQIKHIAEANSKIDKSISSILKPLGVAFAEKNNFMSPSKMVGMSMVELAMTISENKNKYDRFLNTSKSLSKAVFVNSSLISAFEKLQYSKIQKPFNKLDYLFGSSFTQYAKDIDFDEDMKLLDEIGADPEFKEKAQSIVREVEEILSTNSEIVNEDQFDNSLIAFSQWVKKSFGEKHVKSFFKCFLYLLPFIYGYYNSKISSKNLQNTKDEIINKIETVEKKTDRYINALEKKHPNMIAKTDVNLRIRQRKKSRKLGIVKEGQEVMVLERKVKWMKIVYDDIKTDDSMTGWVYIDFFK